MTSQVNPLEVLALYQQLQRRSIKKWPAFRETVGEDGRLRGAHQFRGASRTGRDAGRLVQVQNFPRGNLKDPTTFADLMAAGGHGAVDQCAPTSVMDVLSSTLRAAITAPEGKTFVIADLSSIESRVVAWLAGCKEMLDIFANGHDTYKVFATWYFNKKYEEVTKGERNFCKPPVLGCAYLLSGKGLVAYAEAMGVKLTQDQADSMVRLFRSRFHEVEEMWTWLDQAAKWAITQGDGATISGYHVTLEMDREFLFIRLPSGRRLSYYLPRITPVVPPWNRERTRINGDGKLVNNPNYGKKIDNITYMGYNQFTKGKWVRISTHPGKWVEQITQALSRDIFFHGLKLYEDGGGETVLRVHDELVCVADVAHAEEELRRLEVCMSATPPYADGTMLLGADGFISKRYRKN